MAEQQEKPSALTEVVLLMPHCHAGESFKTGDQIKVTAAELAWLRSHKLIAATGVK